MRYKFREMLRAGELEEREIEINVEQRTSPVQVFSNMGVEQMDVDLQNMFEKLMPRQQQRREMTVAQARKVLLEQEMEALLNKDAIHEEAINLAEETGMIFIDEIDKVCGSQEGSKSTDVSRQGVQRDLLPIVEGTTVQTRYGNVKTDHMLFIAAGAFHSTRPSDLMPELQGRFPLRVELTDLNRDDFLRILTEPSRSLTKQYEALLATDGVNLHFETSGLEAVADLAWQANQNTQNIGARRLHTILEKLLEDVSFAAPDEAGKVVINADYVKDKLRASMKPDDLDKFIL
ncbi:MAG: ATP-dependent protease ATPase subunit HslU [Planctomycetaceae bacterium]